MSKDKYKVEKLKYKYRWIDVGPGPSERGSTIGMYSVLRSYKVTFHSLKKVAKKVEKLQKAFSEDVVIVSKFIGKAYVPGKIVISTYGEPFWQPVDNYAWKRADTRLPFFHLIFKGRPCITSQWEFFKKEWPLSEILRSSEMVKDIQIERLFLSSPLALCLSSLAISDVDNIER